MEKHPKHVEGFNGSLKDLAHAISKMRYDKIAELFKHLEDEFAQEANADGERGYKQVPAFLGIAVVFAGALEITFKKIWKICKKHMPK